MEIEAIGTIHSPFTEIADMPIQPSGAKGTVGQLVLNPELVEGLADLDGFSHLIVLYHFHRAAKTSLTVTPFLDSANHGVFATRAPTRPNHIGLSVLKLNKIRGNIVDVEDIDILNGTPLLDIKPYVPEFDQPTGEVKSGWIQKNRGGVKHARSDQRFA